MKLVRASIIFAILYPAAASSAGFLSSDELLADCEAPPGTAKSFSCTAYVMGVMDLLMLTEQFCPANGMVVQRGLDVVKNYLRVHPERGHFSAASEAGLALKQAFPCGHQPK